MLIIFKSSSIVTMSFPVGTIRAQNFLGNFLSSASLPDGSSADLTLVAPAGKQVVIASDLVVERNLITGGLINPTASSWLAADFIQSEYSTDLVIRAGAAGKIVLNGDIEITGSLSYADSSVNYNNTLILNDGAAVTLGPSLPPYSDSYSNVTMDGGGLLLRGAEYPNDPKALSVCWNISTASSPVLYWEVQGGDLVVSRVVSSVKRAFRFAIDEVGNLIIEKVFPDTTREPVMLLVSAED
jgi:hypothetical protein